MPNMHPSELTAMLEGHRVSGSGERAALVASKETKSRRKKPAARKK